MLKLKVVAALAVKVPRKVKVTSLYMPQRASQRNFGKSLHLTYVNKGETTMIREKETEKGLGWRRKGESRKAQELAEKGAP
jgi:hypothetical protein